MQEYLKIYGGSFLATFLNFNLEASTLLESILQSVLTVVVIIYTVFKIRCLKKDYEKNP